MMTTPTGPLVSTPRLRTDRRYSSEPRWQAKSDNDAYMSTRPERQRCPVLVTKETKKWLRC